MLQRLPILLALAAAAASAAPILFVGLDPEGGGFSNGAAARGRFFSHISGGGTESFEGDCSDPCEPYPLFFRPGLTGQFSGFPAGSPVRPVASAPGGGAQAIYAENVSFIQFSEEVSALGFYVTNLLYVVSPSGQGSLLGLTLGDQLPIYIDPGLSGFAPGSRFTGFIGFIDYDRTYSSVQFGNFRPDTLTNRFYTDLITAAERGEVAPEPANLLTMAAGVASLVWLKSRPT